MVLDIMISSASASSGNIALDDRNTVCAAETDKMAACDTGEDKVSERCGDKLTVLENRDVGMCALGHDVAILGTVILEQAASYLNSLVAARVDCSLARIFGIRLMVLTLHIS